MQNRKGVKEDTRFSYHTSRCYAQRKTKYGEDTDHDRRFLRDGLALAPDPVLVPFMPECRGAFGVPPRMVARDCDESTRVGGVGPRGSRRAWADGGE